MSQDGEYMLRVKMSGEDKKRLDALSKDLSLNLSSYVRLLINEKWERRRTRRAGVGKR